MESENIESGITRFLFKNLKFDHIQIKILIFKYFPENSSEIKLHAPGLPYLDAQHSIWFLVNKKINETDIFSAQVNMKIFLMQGKKFHTTGDLMSKKCPGRGLK